MPKKPVIIAREVDRRLADEDHDVVSVVGTDCHMAEPCPTCPWRKDAVGLFPAEAFRLSAPTSYDMSRERFSCHVAGTKAPRACAGFLLKGADHNMAIRRGKIEGFYIDVRDGGHELFKSYREMAIANGVSKDDECLVLSRDNRD